MKKLKLNLDELASAMEDASWLINYYLDLETGEVIGVTDETRRELERIYQEIDDRETDLTLKVVEAVAQSDLRDWQKQAVLEADQVEAGYGSRYIAIHQAEPYQGYADMEDFIETVQDQRLQNQLWQAIRGRGAFRRFKDVLAGQPRERERWFEFTDERQRQRVLDWLADKGIEPVIEAPAREIMPPPPVRSRLIEEVLNFVTASRQLPGVVRIALIGSLTTNEPDPKDVDLLVTVTDEMDLTQLATLVRRFQGHTQSLNRGFEVFLADPQRNYLGRICPWKRCGPGIRASCDALHCGQRLYLHDDLKVIRLAKSLIIAPPLELWPQVVTRVPLHEDVEQRLLVALK